MEVKLPPLSRAMRVAFTLALAAAYVGWHTDDAFAKGDDDSDDDDGGGEGEGEGKGDKGDGGGDEEDPDDKDQPPVTSGGLFTMDTYPVRENSRPLTMTKGITQLRLGLGT